MLDFKSRKQWEIYLSNSYNHNQLNNSANEHSAVENGQNDTGSVTSNADPPTFNKILDFLNKQIEILESIEENFEKSKAQNIPGAAKVLHTKVESSDNNSNNKSVAMKCIICKESHLLQFCPKNS